MYIAQERLQPYVSTKLISESIHPEAPHVRVYNYTHLCQYQQAWDDVTLQCRGLILDVKNEKVLARPFQKFFNYQEHVNNGLSLPDEHPVITVKYDGSLGILYWLDDKPWIATRGSFTSDQAVWATQWLRDRVYITALDKSITYLYEIVYKENKIVVEYPFEGLVTLAAIHTESGRELPFNEWRYTGTPFLAGRIKPDNLEALASLDEANREGFVIHYPSSNLRLKIKFPSYVRLHKLVTGLTEKRIWEHLRAGGTLEELLVDTPDEMYGWVAQKVQRLQKKFSIIERGARSIVNEIKDYPTRKEQAEFIKTFANMKLVFSMLDGKNYYDIIWRMIEPKGESKFQRNMNQD